MTLNQNQVIHGLAHQLEVKTDKGKEEMLFTLLRVLNWTLEQIMPQQIHEEKKVKDMEIPSQIEMALPI